MAAIAETDHRTRTAITQFAESALGTLTLRPTPLLTIIEDLLDLVRKHELSVDARVDNSGQQLEFCFSNGQQVNVSDRRARSVLRMMCANMAVRSQLPPENPAAFFGATGEFHENCGVTFDQGWQVTWKNTPGDHWFKLSWRGVVPIRCNHEANASHQVR